MPSVKYYPASFYLDISLKDSLYNNKLQVATSIIIKILVPVFRCDARVEAFAVIKRPARDACLCMGEHLAPPAPPAPHFVFLITL